MTDWSITIHFSYIQFCLLNLRYGLTIALAKNVNTVLIILLLSYNIIILTSCLEILYLTFWNFLINKLKIKKLCICRGAVHTLRALSFPK